MAGDTTFTFLDAASNVKTARAGSDAGGNLAPSAVLYNVDGNVLIGQKARVNSVPVALATEDAALLADLLTNTAFNAKDFATQTTLAAVLAKLSSDPATQTTLAAILAKLIAAPATEAKQDTQITAEQAILAKLTSDPATQTTLAAILAKIIAAPATEAKQDALAALIGEVQASPTTNTLLDRLKSIQTALAGTLAISAASLPLPTGAATAANQSTLNTRVGDVTETAPATDTAPSGLNGRLQRIAQNITTLFGRFVAAATLADSTSAPSTTIVGAARMDYNGATLDLARSNVEGTILASAVRAATTTVDFTNHNAKSLMLYVNVTVAGTSTLIIQIYGKDPVSGNYFQINNNPAAISTTGQYGYMCAISGTAPAGSDVKTFWQIVLPRSLRVRVVHGDGSNWTYSIGYALS